MGNSTVNEKVLDSIDNNDLVIQLAKSDLAQKTELNGKICMTFRLDIPTGNQLPNIRFDKETIDLAKEILQEHGNHELTQITSVETAFIYRLKETPKSSGCSNKPDF